MFRLSNSHIDSDLTRLELQTARMRGIIIVQLSKRGVEVGFGHRHVCTYCCDRQRVPKTNANSAYCGCNALCAGFCALGDRERVFRHAKAEEDTIKQAEKAIAVFCQIPIRYIDVSVSEALAYSELFGLYAYDAYMIVAAKQQRCPLLTLDQALMHAAKTAGVGVVEV